MLENAIARRYASAFFSIANEQGALDAFEKEFSTVIETIKSNPELKQVIDDQLMPAQVKKEIVDAVFNGQVSATTVDFVKVVMDKRRENLLAEMFDAFVVYANEARNIQDAEVTSAYDLSEADVDAIKARLAQLTGKNIRLKAEVNPGLIGGVVIRFGDKVIDGSVTRRLAVLKETLTRY